MKNIFAIVLLCLVLVGAGLYAADSASPSPAAETLESVRAERDALKQHAAELETTVQVLRTQRDEVTRQLQDLLAQNSVNQQIAGKK